MSSYVLKTLDWDPSKAGFKFGSIPVHLAYAEYVWVVTEIKYQPCKMIGESLDHISSGTEHHGQEG
jgi:hypothetical protein